MGTNNSILFFKDCYISFLKVRYCYMLKKHLQTQSIVFAFVLFLVCACSDKEPNPKADERNLVESTVVTKRTAAQLQLLAQLSGNVIDPSLLKYDVTVYKVTYTTLYKGSGITASGLVILPYSTADKFPIVSVQHGTIVKYADAPSEETPDTYEILLYSALASSGFITVVPDYLGFGASKNVLHPYYVEEPMAVSVVDNVRAARNLATDKKIALNGKLFLAGYSEGGYATLAAHKYIDENGLKDLQLTASFPAAGGYDVSAVQQHFFALSSYSQPFYIAYVLRSYEAYYDFQSAVSDVFNEPYASKIPSLFNGVTSSGEINGALTSSIGDLIRSDIRTNISTDPRFNYLVNAFQENSLTDWVPKSPIFFYHGDADETVPFSNSQITFQKLLSNGTPANLISLTTLHGQTHASGVTPYFQEVIVHLMQMK